MEKSEGFWGRLNRRVRKWIGDRRNLSLWFLLFAAVAGYVFFFTSNLTLGYSGTHKSTALDTPVTFERNRTVTLSLWDYSPSQKLMEVELLFENGSFDGVDAYIFEAAMRPGDKLVPVTAVIEESSFVVLHLTGIPDNFAEISLRLKVNDDRFNEVIRLYCNAADVRQAEKISEKTKKEYMTDRLYKSIALLESEITGHEAAVTELEAKIDNIRKTVEELEQNKKYLTASEIEKVNGTIESHHREIDRIGEEIEAHNAAAAEAEEKILKLRQQIEDVG